MFSVSSAPNSKTIFICTYNPPSHTAPHHTAAPLLIRQGIGACTVVGLKQLAGRGVEVLQLEVAGSFEGHAEALGVPAPLPQDVLGEAARLLCRAGLRMSALIARRHMGSSQ